MTNMPSILSTISTIDNAVLCRTESMGNFYAIPTEDGYVAVKVSALLNKDTANHKAFDVESAKAKYEAFAKAQEEKANKPKVERGVNAEAEARRNAYDKAISDFFATEAERGKRYSSTEVKALIPSFADVTVMAVGSALIRVAKNGNISTEKGEKGKNLYFVEA